MFAKRWVTYPLALLLALCLYTGLFIQYSIEGGLLPSLVIFCFFVLNVRLLQADWFSEKLRLALPLAVFLGIMYAVGKIWFGVPGLYGARAYALMLVSALGFSFMYLAAIKYLYHLLQVLPADDGLRTRAKPSVFEKRPVLAAALLMLLLWLPHLLLKYPCGMNIDSLDSINSGLGLAPVTSHQPVIYTFGLTAFVKLGLVLADSVNLGLFISGAVNMLGLALAVGSLYAYERELGAAAWCRRLTLLFFALSPFVAAYVGVCIKDVPYMVFLLFWMQLFARAAFDSEGFWAGHKYPSLLVLTGVCLCAVRNNGTAIVFVSALALLALQFSRPKEERKLGLGRKLIVLLLACVLPLAVVGAANRLTGAAPASRREALSLPFQQTARLAAEHPESISPQEAEIIDRVLDFNTLAEDYNPDIVDPVKYKFKESATNEDLTAYLKLWFKQFFREPLCYIKATLAQNYYLFYPEFNNYDHYYSCVHYDFGTGEQALHMGSPSYISDTLGWYYKPFVNMAHELPVLYVINNMTSYIFLLLAFSCYALARKDKELFCLMLPLLVTLFGVFLGPCIRYNERYVFPIIYSCPLLLAAYISRHGRKFPRK